MKGIKKENWNLYVACVAIIVVISAFLVTSFNSYIKDRDHFVSEMNGILELSVQQYNAELLLKGSCGIVSSRGKSGIWIYRNNKEYVCNYDENIDINANFNRAKYDILPPNSWATKQLAKIIQYKMSDRCPPFILVRTDSVINTIDSCKFGTNEADISELEYEYTLPLGFLDKHQLKVYYTYTWELFWAAEGKMLLVIFVLLSLASLCIWLFVKLLRDARKKAENQELFIQALNHDLKSPIAVLQMMIYQIKNYSIEPYSPEQVGLDSKVTQQIKNILSSADRILQDSIDAKGIHLTFKEINLPELIEKQKAAILETEYKNKKIEIETSFQISHSTICADNHHLSRAILNLLQNAVKYSEGDVHIRITCREEGQFIQITLQDNGCGIEKSDLKHIFEKNYRSSNTNKPDKTKGYGIGLAYVKMIIKAHGGTIRVKSERGKGTTFIMKIRHE